MHARMTGKDCRAAGVRNHPGRAVLTGRPTQRTRRPVWVRARRSAADVFCGLLAVTLLAAVLAGVPYALVTVLGLPVPHGLPPMSEFTRQLGVIPILRILSVIVCAAWLQLAVCVLVEIRAAIRGVGLPARVPLSGRTQDFAHWLITAAVLLFSAGTAIAPALLPRGTAPPLAPQAAVAAAAPVRATTAQPASTDRPAPQVTHARAITADPARKIYIVQPPEGRHHDSLWEIAQRHLGDGHRYREIFEMNTGRIQPDGATLTIASLIRPGWILDMPPDADGPGIRNVHENAPGPPSAQHRRPPGPSAGHSSASSSAPGQHPPQAALQCRTQPVHGHARTHTVVQGDDLWRIAVHYLGDGERWHEIYTLNRGRPQPDGRSLTDPNLIYPGWVLQLPAGRHRNTTAPQQRPTPPKPRPGQRSSPEPSSAPSPHTSTMPSSRSSAVPSRPAEPHQRHETHSPVVELPSGVLIGVSLASALGAAIALTRLHQRRRRQPASVPGTAPAEPGLSPALRRVRQAHLAHHGQTGLDADIDTKLTPSNGGSHAASTRPGNHDAEWEIPPRELVSTEAINVATRGGNEVALRLDCAPGIGIEGPGAEGTVRAIVVTLLARRTKDHGEVILAGADARRVLAPGLAGTGLASVPGLVIAPSLEDALTRLEAEIVHRRRLLDDESDTTDLASYRAAHPEALPTVLLVAAVQQPSAGRLTAALTLGRQLGITGVLLGSWPSGPGCTVAGDGQVTVVTGRELQQLSGARMFQLAPEEAAEMLATLSAADDAEAAATPAPPPREVMRGHAADEPDGSRPVRLRILGPPSVEVGGQPITKGLRTKAYELLAYLACHRDGATTETILEALWPGLPTRRANVIFHAVITNIRQVLRSATGASEAGFVPWIRERYRIDAALIDVDLWRFQAALGKAAHADNDGTRQDELRTAAALWRGEFTAGHDGEWIDSWRETLRRDAADVLTRLAQMHGNESPDEAIALLERATTIERYQESLYRRIIQIQGKLGRRDAARRTYHLLESRLAEIDAEPDETTVALLHEVLHPPSDGHGSVGSVDS